ncbi:glutathione S-transferase family protein [Acidisphaera sp. S103]|uniref:glutathione S-transferase family protein n=1 Tax=Acidisphaera sp. S103 TaxID=1747223 RepID=UPI00131CBD14|nr:glutathione S-transferase N-terminal domain-containing protein [Acidisphaera sp. S103]
MIDFYTSPTPNGYKVAIALEELSLQYRLHVLDLEKRQQKEDWYLRINPNGRIPAIVDNTGADRFAVFESGAILIYLAEKTGRLLPTDARRRSDVIQWLMFQMAGVGPIQGQAHAFVHYFPEKIPSVISRFVNEARRLYEILNNKLADREYLCGDFSIADIATWPWIRRYDWPGIDIAGLDHLSRWMKTMSERPACARGGAIPQRPDATNTVRIYSSIVGR